jgi:hypothetical protein
LGSSRQKRFRIIRPPVFASKIWRYSYVGIVNTLKISLNYYGARFRETTVLRVRRKTLHVRTAFNF